MAGDHHVQISALLAASEWQWRWGREERGMEKVTTASPPLQVSKPEAGVTWGTEEGLIK